MKDLILGKREEILQIINDPHGRADASVLMQGSRAACPRNTSSEVQSCGFCVERHIHGQICEIHHTLSPSQRSLIVHIVQTKKYYSKEPLVYFLYQCFLYMFDNGSLLKNNTPFKDPMRVVFCGMCFGTWCTEGFGFSLLLRSTLLFQFLRTSTQERQTLYSEY